VTADHYIRQQLGELMVTVALLRAELDQARERIAELEHATNHQERNA
jgi:hypothetical protein